jgi:c-di-GMP-binding flagellar brake protein YcgR
MIIIQIGVIVFLLLILAIIYQDEHRKRRLARKSTKLRKFWSQKDKNRRKYHRVDAEIDVLYEILSDNRTFLNGASLTRNLSLGGVNLALSEKLFPGTILKLQLNLPQSAQSTTRSIFVQGKVVWTKEIYERFTKKNRKRYFATGIQFLQLSLEDEALLRGFICQKTKEIDAIQGYPPAK